MNQLQIRFRDRKRGHLHQFSAISEVGSWEEGAASSGLCGYTEFSQSLHGLPLCCLVAAMVSITMISVKRGKKGKKKKKSPREHSLSVRSENVNTGQGSFFSCWKSVVLTLEQGAGSGARAVFTLPSLPEWPFSACSFWRKVGRSQNQGGGTYKYYV